MNTIELKRHIHEELDRTENENVLEGICRFLELNTEKEDVYFVSNELKDKLQKSDQQINEGNYMTHEDLNAKIEKWLSE